MCNSICVCETFCLRCIAFSRNRTPMVGNTIFNGFDFLKSIDIVVMVILGGMGRTVGVVIAAVLLTILPEALRGFSDYRMILYSLMIVILMITRPQGLFVFGKARPAKA